MRDRVRGRRLSLAIASAVAAAALATFGVRTLYGQQPGFKRVELARHAGGAGHEAVLARGEINQGAAVPKHTHPGEEMAYVLEGQVTIEIEGKPPLMLKPGDTFVVAAGQVHTAKNTGTGTAKILSTYIV